MQYEGKIYGRVGGKLVELHFPQNLIDFEKRLIQKIDALIETEKANAESFKDEKNNVSAIQCLSMVEGYLELKSLIIEKQI